MYFYNYLKQFNNKVINIYIDMDGVVADYDVLGYEMHKGEDNVYLDKRPVMSSINILKEVSTLNNVNLYILSVSRKNSQISGKKEWLSKNMNYIKDENINIIPRDINENKSATLLKKEFLKEHTNSECVNIMIDDSHQVLDAICSLNNGIIPLHITSILD